MRTSSSSACILTALAAADSVGAFTAISGNAGQRSMALLAHQSDASSSSLDRSAFLKTSMAALISFAPSIASAVDDLSMPSPEEQKAADDAMAERLRIKAELKKKAAKPMGYKESMAQEMNKQKELQKSKEERRIALCEELGRGC